MLRNHTPLRLSSRSSILALTKAMLLGPAPSDAYAKWRLPRAKNPIPTSSTPCPIGPASPLAGEFTLGSDRYFGTSDRRGNCRTMPRYFFHLAGRLPANDLIGHECSNDDEAREHGSFIAHRVGTEKPDMVHQENFILVTNETDDELFRIPIASTLSAGTALHPRAS